VDIKCFVIPVITGDKIIVTKGLKKYMETIPGKYSIDYLQKKPYTKNIAHYKESATIRNLKPEWWGSPLVQEKKYQAKPMKREEMMIIIILIIIIIIIITVWIVRSVTFVEHTVSHPWCQNGYSKVRVTQYCYKI
jgi:hypothetical protein